MCFMQAKIIVMHIDKHIQHLNDLTYEAALLSGTTKVDVLDNSRVFFLMDWVSLHGQILFWNGTVSMTILTRQYLSPLVCGLIKFWHDYM